MALAVAGIEGDGYDSKSHPHDPDDLNRCLLFLDAVPEARNHLGSVAKLSTEWQRLIDHWAELEECFCEEVGLNWNHGKSAPETYALMEKVMVNDQSHRPDDNNT